MRTIATSFALLLAFAAGAQGITTQQARTAAPGAIDLAGQAAAVGSSLSFPKADHVHNLTGVLGGANGGLGQAQPTCSGTDKLTCNGTICSCATDSAGPSLPLSGPNGGLGQAQPTCSGTDKLTCNGTTCSCAADVGGAPAGANEQVQFNANGSFGADSNFRWDNTLKGLYSPNLMAYNIYSTPDSGSWPTNSVPDAFRYYLGCRYYQGYGYQCGLAAQYTGQQNELALFGANNVRIVPAGLWSGNSQFLFTGMGTLTCGPDCGGGFTLNVGTSGGGMSYGGYVPSNGTRVAHAFWNAIALNTTGDKIASFYSDQGVTERAYIDKDGRGYFNGTSVGTPTYSLFSSLPININSVTLSGEPLGRGLISQAGLAGAVFTNYVGQGGVGYRTQGPLDINSLPDPYSTAALRIGSLQALNAPDDARLIDFYKDNMTTLIAQVTKDGGYRWALSPTLKTCGANFVGLIERQGGSAGTYTHFCACEYDGTTYLWRNLATNAIGNTTTCPSGTTIPSSAGGTGLSTAAIDTVLLANPADTWTAAALPSCSNGTTSKLLYNTTTHAFSCGTDQTSAGGGYATVQDEGSPLTQRTTLNFTGSGITCTDDSGNGTTDCDVPGGTGAPTTATYWTATSEAGLSAEVNLGALTTGMLKHTVAAGVSTPATATAGTDYSAGTSGLANGVLKSTTGTGALSIAAGSDIPAVGSDTQVIFNDGGSSYGGDAGLTYNKTTDKLTLSGVGGLETFGTLRATQANIEVYDGGGIDIFDAPGMGGPSGWIRFKHSTTSPNGTITLSDGALRFSATSGVLVGDGSSTSGTGTILAQAPTGETAFGVVNNGARIDFGAGTSDYASSDGTTVTFAGPVAASSLTLTTPLALQYLADDATSGLCLLSGGGGGNPTWTTCPGGGAPTTASYWTATAEAGLSNETNLGALTSGILKHTVTTGTSVPATATSGTDYAPGTAANGTGLVISTTGTGALTAYGGTSCTNQFPRSLNASGAATCASVDLSSDTAATTLPLAKLTDGATAGKPLVAGGAGGDPNYATSLAVAGGGTGLTTIAADQTFIATATDTLAAVSIPSCAAPNFVRYDTSTHAFTCAAPPMDISAFYPGKPANSATMMRIRFASAVRLPASLTGSQFYIATNPTATLVLDIRKRLSGSTSSSIGSLSISTGGVFTVTFSSQTDFAAGDHLEVINAASADATAADFSLTFLGTRIP